jgi:NADH-quinone oxidoreductase subunit N
MTAVEWGIAAPVLSLLGAAFLCIAADLFFPRSRERGVTELIAYAGLVAALFCLWKLDGGVGFKGSLVSDGLSRFVGLAVILATMLASIASADSLAARRVLLPEYFALLLSAAAGMLLLVMSQDLITMFLSVEILSLALYVLCGVTRQDGRSNESAMKYFVLGSFATGFLLYGMALVYGASGSVLLEPMAHTLPTGSSALALAGVGLLIAGFAFKIGAAPFHMWVPDVYEGAPTPVTAFMSVAVKTAAIGALIRLLASGLSGQEEGWGPLVAALSALTMIVGNLGALLQKSVKRMLAWSSVAHAGYALIGIAAAAGDADGRLAGAGPSAALFYTATYTVMTIGAFLFLMYAGRAPTSVSPGREAETYDDLNGLAKRRPWGAAIMTVLMVSLAGIPPTAGFFGKFTLFRAAVHEEYIALAIIAVLTSVVSAAYYLRVVVSMYMKEPAPAAGDEAPQDRPDLSAGLAVVVSGVLTLYLGLMPGPVLDWATSAVNALLR